MSEIERIRERAAEENMKTELLGLVERARCDLDRVQAKVEAKDWRDTAIELGGLGYDVKKMKRLIFEDDK